MNKWYGSIGYSETVEVEPGVYEEQITPKTYYGDIISKVGKFQISSEVIDDKDIAVKLSIVADPYANENFQYMRYVEWMGAKWKITNTEVRYPRIILSLGGLYNGNSTRTPKQTGGTAGNS